jgi:hypothetical protein
MLTVRLPENLERELEVISEKKCTTKSEIVKTAIVQYIRENSKTPYEVGRELFGCDESDITVGSVNYKQRIRRQINEKHSY